MVDPYDALTSFQRALDSGQLRLQRGSIDTDLFVHADSPNGKHRFIYIRLEGQTITAMATAVMTDPIKGVLCFQLGVAVPKAFRSQGRAKDAVNAAIIELKHGLARNKISTFFVEAVVGTHNEASKRVAAATISTTPVEVVTMDLCHKYSLFGRAA
jgi:hypothetical protein